MQQLKVLHLTLKKEWFDMIASGEKREEYREIKPYWQTRLIGKHYDLIEFRNGYGINVPNLRMTLESISVGMGNTDWGAPKNKEVFILSLSKTNAACGNTGLGIPSRLERA